MNFIQNLGYPEKDIALAFLPPQSEFGDKSDEQIAHYLANGTMGLIVLHYLAGYNLGDSSETEITLKPITDMDIQPRKLIGAMQRLKNALKKIQDSSSGSMNIDWLNE